MAPRLATVNCNVLRRAEVASSSAGVRSLCDGREGEEIGRKEGEVGGGEWR